MKQLRQKIHYVLCMLLLASLSMYGQSNIELITKSHIEQNKAKYNLSDSDISEFRIIKNNVSSVSGVHHIHGIQQHNGIDIDQANFSMHLKDGKVFRYNNNFVSNLNDKIKDSPNSSSNTAISVLQNVLYDLGLKNHGTISIINDKSNSNIMLNVEGGSIKDVTARLFYYKNAKDKIILTWHFTIRQLNHEDSWNVIVEVSSNKILQKWDLALKCSDANHDHNHKELSTYGPILENNESVEEVTNYLMPLNQSYEVFAHPIESPNDANAVRTIEENPFNVNASPDGWHHIVGEGDFFTTKGNNIDAYSHGNINLRPNEADFNFVDYPFYNTYSVIADRAAVTNAFYWANLCHDIFYEYGFDEAAGNFQQHNYTPFGAGGDAITVLTHSGSCGSFFEPSSSDGISPTIKISSCNTFGPNMDGAYDNWVMIHEYTHGLVNRIIGNNRNPNNPEHMDEGWADWFGMMLTMNHEENGLPNRYRPLGIWHEGNNSDYALRTYDANRSPNDLSYYNYANLDGLVEEGPNEQGQTIDPYRIAEVWGAILWDLTWALIDDYGFDSDVYYGNGGNNMALKLVMEAMHYTGSTPDFQTGLEGLLAADQDLFNGAFECHIKTAFTNRGFGDGASSDIFGPYIDFYHSFDEYPCDESGVSLFITNTDYPTCNEVDYESEDPWFYVTANILTPDDYTITNLNEDLGNGHISLELFSAGTVSISLQTILADNTIATLENNIIQLSFPITINTFLGIEPNWVRNYDFQINANINGSINNHRVPGIDLTECPAYTCEMNEININTDNFPSCIAPDTPFPLNIGGSFQLVGKYKAVRIELVITPQNGDPQILIIDNFDEASFIELNGYPEGNIGLYDFDVNASNFVSGLQGDYTIQVFFYTRLKDTIFCDPVTSQELTISFDCNPNNLCENQLFADSGTIPICPNLNQTDFDFQICGTYCTDDSLTSLQLDIINHVGGASIFNTSSTPSTPGEFCFTINDEDFVNGFTGHYDFEITATYQNALTETYSVNTIINGIDFDECLSQSICDNVVTPAQLAEGFESNFGVWVQPDNNTIDWMRDSGTVSGGPTNGSDGTNWFAQLYQETAGPANSTLLVSPCIDLNSMATAQLDYDTYFWGPFFEQQSTLLLEISIDNGLSWTPIDTVPSLTNTDWGENVVDLTAFVNQEIRLRFNVVSTNGIVKLGLDNINLEYTPIEEEDPCEGVSVSITNENEIPTCEQLGDSWFSFPIDIAINVPDGYSWEQAISDYNDNYYSLDIIDLDSPNNDIYFTVHDGAPGSASLENGVLELSYLITNEIMQGANNSGNYGFRMNIKLTAETGFCEVTDTAYALSFDDCQEADPCATITDYNIDGSILCWEDITDEDYFIEFQASNDCPGSNADPLPNIFPFQQNDNCFDLNFIVSITGRKCLRWRVSTLCGDWSDWCLFSVGGPPDYNFIDYEDCEASPVSDCVDANITITSEIPKCEDLGSNFSFNICGTMCEDVINGPFISVMTLEILDIDNDDQIIDTIIYDQTVIGEFCFNITDENFSNGLIGNYDYRITVMYTDASEPSESIRLEGITFEPCPIECDEIKDVKLEEGFFLTWDPEVQADEYTFLYAINPDCDRHFDPTESGFYTLTTSNNYIDLRRWSEKFDKCISYKIISDCGSETSWCNLIWADDHYEFLDGNCENYERRSQDLIKISPNPATNEVIVSVENTKITSIEVYDLYGKPVQDINNVDAFTKQIHVSRISRGYYIIKVILEDGTSQYKNLILK